MSTEAEAVLEPKIEPAQPTITPKVKPLTGPKPVRVADLGKAPAKADPNAEPADPVKYAFTLYRCSNCKNGRGEPGYDFNLPKENPPICPQCDNRMGEPGRGMLIQKLSVIHWSPPESDVTIMACTKNPVRPSTRVSGEPIAVTCPACIAELAKANAVQLPFDPEHDFEVTLPQ